jgi:hypothetical protein
MFNGTSKVDFQYSPDHGSTDHMRYCYELQRLVNQQQAQLDYQHRLLGDISEDLQSLRKLVNKLIEE